jgi:hypothetical protein
VNEASKQKIHQALNSIATEATPDDVFFLSFSGQGYSNQQGQFYIPPSDVQGTCDGWRGRLCNRCRSRPSSTFSKQDTFVLQ